MKQRPIIERSFPLLDLEIDRSEGDGRVVIAYAATFDEPYPVVDQWGSYDETIDRSAFNRAIAHGIERVQVIFNHGLTIYGTPSERYSMPIGVPLEIRPEAKGLLTRTAYAKTDLGDEVLELVRSGALRAQSFRGTVYRSAPATKVDGRKQIRRLELGLKEYGPAPFVANPRAEIMAVRSALLGKLAPKFSEDQILDILEALGDDEVDLDAMLAEISERGTGTPPPAAPQDTQEQPAPVAPVDPGSSVELAEAEQVTLRARHHQP